MRQVVSAAQLFSKFLRFWLRSFPIDLLVIYQYKTDQIKIFLLNINENISHIIRQQSLIYFASKQQQQKACKMNNGNLRVSSASSLNFDDASSLHSGQYRVRVTTFNASAEESSSSQSPATSIKISPSMSNDLKGKTFKCFNCYDSTRKQIIQCRICQGNQVIKYTHPIVEMMENIIQKRMNKVKEKQVKNATKKNYLEVAASQDIIKQQSFVSSQEQLSIFCKICQKELDPTDVKGNAQNKICPSCSRNARTARLFGNDSKRQKQMHIEIPSPMKLRKISEHIESQQGLSMMIDRAKRIQEIDSVQKMDNSVASCQSPRTLKKRSSKTSGYNKNYSVLNYPEEEKQIQIVQNILLGDQLELMRAAQNQQLLKSSGGLNGSGNLNDSLLELWNGLNQVSNQECQHFLDQNQIENQNDMSKSEHSFKSLQQKMELSDHSIFNEKIMKIEINEDDNGLAKMHRINHWQIAQQSFSSFNSYKAEPKFLQKKIVELVSLPIQKPKQQPQNRIKIKQKYSDPTIQIKPQKQYLFYDYICDICSITPIPNKKYHCTVCQDYDICQSCFNSRKGEHEHSKFSLMDGQALLKDREEHVEKLKQSKRMNIKGSIR